ncbi:MAG: ABC transporter ATP-binding protein [Acidobacteriia bacterium]|nr:ABC transporter ATP-binding protein [Terriglobia bacterium]
MNSALCFDNLSHRYGKNEALHGLDMAVPRGSLYAFLGPNGAGKTTAIHVLMNLIHPSEGNSTVLGVDSRRLGPAEVAQIGYVSENQKLPAWMTVAQLVSFCKPLYRSWDDDLCRRLLRQFDLPPECKIKSLSRGMKLKAAMVTALSFHPRLLVLDEPFGGLDAAVRDELVRGMLELADQDEWTLFISSHDLEDIENLVDYIGFLNNGRLILSEELDRLRGRHCEVEVTLPEDARVPDNLPHAWVNLQVSHNLVRFTDTHYEERASASLITKFFPGATDFFTKPLSLRSIFILLARQSAGTASEGGAA